jgi:uncharacterized protein (DUF1015 family)
MAVIKEFKGTRYNTEIFERPETLFAPPYDVVDDRGRDALVAAQPFNVFKLELPRRADCDETAVPDAYQCAASLLNTWLNSQVLVVDKQPSLYTYAIEFGDNGNRYTRRGFIGLVRADDWAQRTILPHEKTFNKVTEQRLQLRLATRAQFSQIFMLYRHDKRVSEVLDVGGDRVLASVEDSLGNLHTLGQILDPEAISRIKEAISQRPLYIADGHHRYTTAINYRKKMSERYGNDPDAPYNFTMAYLVDAKDPGLIVLPTHRIISLPPGMDMAMLEARLSEAFEIRTIAPAPNSAQEAARTMEQALAAECTQAIGLMEGGGGALKLLCLKPDASERLLADVGHRELASLDVVVLEKVAFKRALRIDVEELEVGKELFYEADSVKAVENLRNDQVLFFMNPTQVEQVLDVADAGLTMPHKSTFFYPKILTGLVMHVEEQRG